MTEAKPSAGELERLARASAPGSEKRHYFLTIWGDSATPEERERDAEFSRAANPQTLLALLADWRLMKDALEGECYCTDGGTHPSVCNPCNVIEALHVRD